MKEKIIEILKTIRPEYDFSGDEDFIEAGMLDSYDIVTLVTNMEITFIVYFKSRTIQDAESLT